MCRFVLICLASLCGLATSLGAGSANRFTGLDEPADLYYPGRDYPKLITPQWVGEEGVEAVLVLAIDDMREPKPYETYLRPILDRLKKIDGRAPVSIMSCQADPMDPQLQSWLAEGLSIETHTIDHPCPILQKTNFPAAKSTYDRCVDLFHSVPNSRPVAFRTPCMDGINSASPRLFAEILMRNTPRGNFLSLSSSIGVVLTEKDPENPKELVLEASGQPRFPKYLLPGFVNYIEDYPYPYLIGNMIWETPFCLPDDYEGSRVSGDKSPRTVGDMKAAIDAVVAKKGIWVMTFHPYQWIANAQVVELIDHVVAKHGRKAKFLNLREVNDRLQRNLLGGQPIRAADGRENGVRLLDLNSDGYLDVAVGNGQARQTRVWQPETRTWRTGGFPAEIARGVRFGVAEGLPCAFQSDGNTAGFWVFSDGDWVPRPEMLAGLELGGERIRTLAGDADRGVRFRDFDGDGACELIVSNPEQNAVFAWEAEEKRWRKLEFGLPDGVSIVTANGADNGVRFRDFNKDGTDDVIASNERSFGLWLGVPKLVLGFKPGWSRQVLRGQRGQMPEIPMIARGGAFPNNGAWFTGETMFVQNEETAALPDLVERVSIRDLLTGFQPAPKSPAEGLRSMVTDPALAVELAAHEPAVQDPVAFEWGADGTLWVVEMRDYPRGILGKAAGVVKRLRDEDGDGFYENWSVFLDGLNYPNGVTPWRGGVLISAAPDILFAEDRDGDGRADRTEILFSGFVEGNPQHRVNGFELGLDGWFHGANGDSGGRIRSAKTGREVSIAGRDFRFRPDTGEFEPTAGQTQYGKRRDDWGDWFGGANYTWGWHYLIPERYLARNPSLAVRTTHRTLNDAPDGTRAFPISRVQQRFNDVGLAGHVTSGCGFAPYRGGLFGGEYQRSIFTSEPSHNVVHREVLEADGVSFRSHRAAAEREREFLASTDPWFRPVTVKTGPDGAIYVADMYRLVIEHPEWIPEDVQERIDVRAGEDRGRIYRVRPRAAALRRPADLTKLSGAELVRAIDSPNGWQRDTVQRLLIERRPMEATPVLRQLARSADSAKVRLQALCALECLGSLGGADVLGAMSDPHPALRGHGARMAEPFLGAGDPDQALAAGVLALAEDPEIRVRCQAAFTLGYMAGDKAAPALLKIARRDFENADVLTAIASSAVPCADELLSGLLGSDEDSPALQRLARHLVKLVSEGGGRYSKASIIARFDQARNDPAGWKLAAIAPLLSSDPAQRTRLAARARKIVLAGDSADADRAAALDLLGNDAGAAGEDLQALGSLLTSERPPDLQVAAVARLGQIPNPSIPEILLERWSGVGSEARNAMLALLLKRGDGTRALVAQLASGAMRAEEIGAGGRQALLGHASPAIRSEAEKIFRPNAPDREAAIASARAAAQGLPGRTLPGRALFETHCALCHRAGEAGRGAGPNLAMLNDQSDETLLTAILDPNRAVEEKYRNYNLELKNGDSLSGFLLGESANSVTLMGIAGVEQTILRRDLESMRGSVRSPMPEGFEQFLKAQDLADLLAFIRQAARN